MSTVVGSAQDAFANAQAILASHKKASYLYWTYADFAHLDTNQAEVQFTLGEPPVKVDFATDTVALDIKPNGWALMEKNYSTTNPSGWAITAMMLGGTKPFANKKFLRALETMSAALKSQAATNASLSIGYDAQVAQSTPAQNSLGQQQAIIQPAVSTNAESEVTETGKRKPLFLIAIIIALVAIGATLIARRRR